MTLKRKPPAGNVRRVVPIKKNLRYAVVNCANETVQCESFQERKLTLLFDRDATIQAYRSQPEQFRWMTPEGKTQTYVPDFMVWRTTGEVEIHEVTLTSRQEKLNIKEREQAAHQICQQRGWRYIIHTEATLPSATEEANLFALYRYRPTIYANSSVSSAVHALLGGGASRGIGPLITEIAQALSLLRPTIVSALCHLLWHQVLEADLTSRLLFVNAALAPDMIVRLGEKGAHV